MMRVPIFCVLVVALFASRLLAQQPGGSPLEQAARIKLAGAEEKGAILSGTLDALRKPIDVPFSQATPLNDAMRYFQTATRSPDLSRGLQIYIEPSALQEVDKSYRSPVQLNEKNVPVATALTTLARTMGLIPYVQRDGVIIVTTPESATRTGSGTRTTEASCAT